MDKQSKNKESRPAPGSVYSARSVEYVDKPQSPLVEYITLNGGCLESDSLTALFETGSNPNQKGADGDPILFSVTKKSSCNLRIIKAFLDAGADMRARDKHGNSVPMSAALALMGVGNVPVVAAEFLSRGFSPLDLFEGFTPELLVRKLIWKAGSDKLVFLLLMEAGLRLCKPQGSGEIVQAVGEDLFKALDMFLSHSFAKIKATDTTGPSVWVHPTEIIDPRLAKNLLLVIREAIEKTEFNPLTTLLDFSRPDPLQLNDRRIKNLINLLLKAMEEDPGTAIRFLKDFTGNGLVEWAKAGLGDAPELVRRLASLASRGEAICGKPGNSPGYSADTGDVYAMEIGF